MNELEQQILEILAEHTSNPMIDMPWEADDDGLPAVIDAFKSLITKREKALLEKVHYRILGITEGKPGRVARCAYEVEKMQAELQSTINNLANKRN